MIRAATAAIAVFFGLTTALVACSSGDEATDPCVKNPKARGCSSGANNAPASAASTYDTPVTAPPAPVAASVVDAGYDAPHKPEAGDVPPKDLPPTNYACADLMSCCGRVPDFIERAACLAIAYGGSESSCSTGIITYQVAGGCGNLYGGGGGYGSGGSDPCAYSNDPYCCDYYQGTPSCQYYYP